MNSNLNKRFEIPYWRARTFNDQINESSSRRNISIFIFAFKKIKIFTLTWLAYYCPFIKLRIIFNRWKGVHIGKDVFIGPACIFEFAYPEYIYIEDYVSIAGNVLILAHQNPYHHFNNTLESYVAPTIIREGAFLAIRTTVLPGVEIGKYTIISAGSTISRSTDEKVILSGNPPRKIGEVKL